MKGEEAKKIFDAMDAIGFEVKLLEMEKDYSSTTDTGAIIIKVIPKEENNG